MTDNSLEIQKWHILGNTVIPANGYTIFWAGGLNKGNHTNFKLSKGGEYIGLFSPFLELIDELTYHQQTTDISYGRNSCYLSE